MPPTEEELNNLYIKTRIIKHPETKKRYLTDGRLVFLAKPPYDIQFTIDEQGNFTSTAGI